jgi:hypothetical protein
LLTEVLLQQGSTTYHTIAPGILNLLTAWATILVHHHRVLLVSLKVGGLDHPSVKLLTVCRRQRKQLTRSQLVVLQPVTKLVVVDNGSQNLSLVVA